MKKLLLIILVLGFNVNSSFALDASRDFPLANRALKNNPTYKQLHLFDIATVKCVVDVKASKKTDYLETSICTSKSDKALCMVYRDKKIAKNYKPLKEEMYCWSSYQL
jgi:hypothetical protein